VDSSPANAYENALRPVLPVAGFGEPLRYLSVTGSTNDEALSWARAGAGEGALVVADHQTAGRGRRGRTWHAPAGTALLFSLVLRPRLTPDHLGLLTTALGVAGAEAARSFGVDASVKWPNDVTVAGKKLAGVLVESRLSGRNVDAAVAGMGFNVSVSPRALPEDVAGRATSLSAELGSAPSRPQVLRAVLAALAGLYESLASEAGRARVVARAEELSSILGSAVAVRMADGSLLTGEATGLTESGALVLQMPDGPAVASAGEIETVRPA
jgi:BirA family transcriptional regulator, biotin operon repressor / biotin---[acetyl-CoA-carboxylase] ligase